MWNDRDPFDCDEIRDVDHRIDSLKGWERDPFPPDPEERDLRDEGRSVEIISAAALFGQPVPPREWLIDGLIPTKNITLVTGDGGVGKSLLVLQLGVAIATGRPWIGNQCEPGQVLYVSAEDDLDEIHRRLADIARGVDVGLDEMADLHIACLAGKDAVLAAPEGRMGVMKTTPLFTAIERMIDEQRPKLVIVDNLADAFAGDENNRAQARQFIGALRGLAIRFDTTVVLLAHPSLSGMANGTGTSGSTGWSNSVRSRLYLSRILVKAEGTGGELEPDPDLRTLSTKKANYGPRGGEIKLKWRDGMFFNDEAFSGGSFEQAARGMQAERVFLDLLDRRNQEGRFVGPSAGPNYAPAVLSKDPANGGFGRFALEGAMNSLFQKGEIAVEEIGPPSRRIRRIVRAMRTNGGSDGE